MAVNVLSASWMSRHGTSMTSVPTQRYTPKIESSFSVVAARRLKYTHFSYYNNANGKITLLAESTEYHSAALTQGGSNRSLSSSNVGINVYHSPESVNCRRAQAQHEPFRGRVQQT
jgi:hypothetical protein